MMGNRKAIDLMGSIQCNGARAFPTTWLIGEGLSFNLYSAWTSSYPSNSFSLRYFSGSSSTAITDLETCTPLPTSQSSPSSNLRALKNRFSRLWRHQ